MVDAYLAELTERLTPMRGVYLIGSAARGAYVEGSSDLDVLAVAPGEVDADAIVARCSHDALPCPARKLELVVYAPDGATVELNLNTGRDGTSADRGEEWFWFVVDRAIAVGSAKTLAGPPPDEVIARPGDEEVARALDEMDAWWAEHEPGEDARIAAARSEIWRRERRWATKAEVS